MLNHSKIYLMIFLIVSFVTAFYSSIDISFSLSTSSHDNSLIAKSTDCITSMMTSTLIGLNSDCAEEIDKVNHTTQNNNNPFNSNMPTSTTPSTNAFNSNMPTSTTPSTNAFNLSKNNPFYSEFQNNNNKGPIVSGINADSPNSVNGDLSSPLSSPSSPSSPPPPDNPATFIDVKPSQTQSYQQQQQISRIVDKSGNTYYYESIRQLTNPTKNNTDITIKNELDQSIDGKNKHSKEISACFDRAFANDKYLSDDEIIQCVKDRNSFQPNSSTNILVDTIHSNNSNTKSDDKHSKEISACFDRAFANDKYLSDDEIIQCVKDRNSYK